MKNCNNDMLNKNCHIILENCEEHNSVRFRCHDPYQKPKPCPPGPEGPQGPALTETSAFAANTSGSIISVVLLGTLVPLPNAHTLDSITVNSANTIFTVHEDGRYYISYSINLTAGLLLGSRILINNVPNLASQINPVITVSSFNNSIIVPLTAGSTISLQLFWIIRTSNIANRSWRKLNNNQS